MHKYEQLNIGDIINEINGCDIHLNPWSEKSEYLIIGKAISCIEINRKQKDKRMILLFDSGFIQKYLSPFNLNQSNIDFYFKNFKDIEIIGNIEDYIDKVVGWYVVENYYE